MKNQQRRQNITCILTVIIPILFITTSAFPSITRTRTMGDAGMIVQDEANFWFFPAAIVNNPNQATFELGGRTELPFYSSMNYGFAHWAGGSVALDKNSQNVLGAFWSETSQNSPFSVFNSAIIPVNHQADFFFGKRIQFGSLGLHLSHGSGRQEVLHEAGTDSKTSATQTRLEFSIANQGIEATFGYQLSRLDAVGNKIRGHNLIFRARNFEELRPALRLVPMLDCTLGLENRESTVAYNGLYWNIAVGIGVNYQPDAENLLVLGANLVATGQQLENESAATSNTTAIYDLPFVFGGLESALTSWLHVRFGFQKALRRISQTTDSGFNSAENIRTEAPFAFTAGIGAKYRRFVVDLSWDSDFLKRGPYFLSGSQGEMFNLVSVNYQF